MEVAFAILRIAATIGGIYVSWLFVSRVFDTHDAVLRIEKKLKELK